MKLPGHAAEGRAARLEFHEDEISAVLDGEITFFVGDRQYDLGAGDVAFGPRGVPHSYVVRSPRSRMLVTFAPAGTEKWFIRNGTPVATTAEPPPPFDLDAAITTAGEYGLRVVGPPPVHRGVQGR